MLHQSEINITRIILLRHQENTDMNEIKPTDTIHDYKQLDTILDTTCRRSRNLFCIHNIKILQ